MSFGRLSATFHLRGLTAIQFRVLACLANHENDQTGQCNPSYATIAKETEISGRYAKEVVEALCNLKLISAEETFAKKKCHGSNTYHFNFEKIQLSEGSEPQFTTMKEGSEPQFTTLGTTDHQGVVNHSSPKSINIESRTESYSTSPTPPQQQAIATQELKSVAGGGGGIGGGDKKIETVPWPLNDRFQSWFHAEIIENGPITEDSYFNIVATFNTMSKNGGRDATGHLIKDWRRYFRKLINKERAKWNGLAG